ncbi:hypothetical protein GCM10010832_22300 [Psychroflexus planctonicus]|uniref:Uncharacterized protein n=2 Tax=Psychroflexus planctonicus TaxID=1526575 RepID=A0ABQ1SKX6_9FLAO|nr:hypothetical protein GCM10010832_22300 [Psychroflexus planctonicus]
MLFFANNIFAQDYTTQKIQEIGLIADRFVGEDKFENLFYINKNTLFRKSQDRIVEYKALQLGDISSVDLLNPLRISVFYKDANTVVILDNRLNELKRIAFDRIANFKMVDFCTTANDKSLWIFNADTQELEIFNYNQEKSALQTLPISENIINQKSNFNFCWLQTENGYKQFNVYGSLIKEVAVKFDALELYKNYILLLNKKGDSYYFNYKSEELSNIEMPKIDYKQALLNNEKLYLYDGKKINIYKITPNN